MKIAICGSMHFYQKMIDIQTKLEKQGFEVFRPRSFEEMGLINYDKYTQEEGKKLKVQYGLIKDYYKKILQSEAVLIINYEKRNIQGYIGGNTLMEMGFAFVNNRDIFMVNQIPDLQYKAEIESMKPIIIGEGFKKINKHYEELPKVYLSSQSKIKLEAVSLGLRDIGMKYQIIGLDVKSSVSEQPIGLDETIEGAENRITALKKQVDGKGKYEYLVSIESGLIYNSEKNNYFDLGVCIIENFKGERETSLSAGIHIPTDIAEDVIQGNLDLGPYVMKKYSAEEKDPVYIFTNKKITRAQLLQQAVSNCAAKFIK